MLASTTRVGLIQALDLSQMYLLSKQGRGAFLTFLRNLTPQALLLSVAAILFFQWTKDHSSWLNLGLSILISALAFLAGYVNFEEFAESAISRSNDIAERGDLIRAETSHPGTRLKKIICYIVKDQPQTLLELLLAMGIAYLGLLAVVWTAFSAAARALR